MILDMFRYRYATLVFASWDYHLTDYGAAANLRRSIRQQLREMLNDAADEEVQITVYARLTAQIRKVTEEHMSACTRQSRGYGTAHCVMRSCGMQAVGLGLFWPATVAAVAMCSYYTLKHEDTINRFIGTDFATSVILSLITTTGAHRAAKLDSLLPSRRLNAAIARIADVPM